MGRNLYGDKVSVHMLGVEENFAVDSGPNTKRSKRVINIASLQPRKRPEMFLTLAESFPDFEFVWFGEGTRRLEFIAEAERRGLQNLSFPGSRTPAELAIELQNAYVFAMPSNSEGVPKVTQEAAACGLPIVIFGHYESPTVVEEQNGFVVWSDEDFAERLGRLLSDSALAARMGERSLQMAQAWSWDVLAGEWEREILAHIR
jgi:glycosyltransferase involved in cell wall biosynthesis